MSTPTADLIFEAICWIAVAAFILGAIVAWGFIENRLDELFRDRGDW